jgi:cellulose synthase (UDP-forming)
LAPASAGSYHVQRMRWGQGAMQVLRKLKPLTRKNLTLQQRISYFAGTAAYFEGWQKTVFYLMPLFYFYTGILPVAGDQREFLMRLIPYIVISIVAFELLSRGTGYLFLSERFTMVRVWTYMLAALAIFSSKPLKFNVTPKGKSTVPRMAYMPQLALLVLSILAPIWATVAVSYGWIDYTAPGWASMAFWMNGVWAVWNCCFAYYVVRHVMAMKQQRNDHRFEEQIPIQVQVDGMREAIPALTADLNPSGVGFRATQRLEPGSRVTIQLPIVPRRVRTTGVIRHVQDEKTRMGQTYIHEVQFDDIAMDDRDAI